MSDKLQEAVSVIKSGDKVTGQRLLVQVIKADPQNEKAWYLLAHIQDDPQRKKQCLQKVLQINPDNEKAEIRLRRLQAQPAELARIPNAERSPEIQRQPSKPTPARAALLELQASQARRQGSTKPTQRTGLQIDLSSLDLRQVFGIAACVILCLGVFAPIARIPIAGQMNYFQNGQGDGVIILALAAISLILIVLRQYRWLWLTGLLTFGIIGYTLINLLRLISELRKMVDEQAADNLFGGLIELMFESVQIEWGWVVLVLGAVMLLITPLLPSSQVTVQGVSASPAPSAVTLPGESAEENGSIPLPLAMGVLAIFTIVLGTVAFLFLRPQSTSIGLTSPSSTPTPTPLPARDVVIPGGWRTYTVLDGELSLAYPPDWQVVTENPSSVELQNTRNQQQFFFIRDISVITPGEDFETHVRELKLEYVNSVSMLDEINFTAQGMLNTPSREAYVTGAWVDYVYDDFDNAFLVTYATDGARSAFIRFQHIGSTSVPPGIIQLAGQIAQSIEFK